MKILVVDDDQNKIRQLKDYIAQLLPSVEVLVRHSYQSGLEAALFESPTLIVLDMTMPNYDVGGMETGGKERRYAGLQILKQLRRKSAEAKTIIVTQFEQFGEGDQLLTLDQLRMNLAAEFSDSYLGSVYYQAGDSRWRDELRDILVKNGFLPSSEDDAQC